MVAAPIGIALLLLVLVGIARAGGPGAALPPDLPEAERDRLRQVTEHVSVAARWDGEAFLLRRDVFEFLLDHPEFATHVIRALEFGRYRIWREPDGLWLDDAAGALVRFHLAHATPGSRLFYLQGRYRPPVLPSIHGRVVVVLEYAVEAAANGRSRITPAMASYVRIDNGFVDALARLFHGAVSARAAKVTRRIVVDIARTARAIDEDPARVDGALRARPDVPPRELAAFRRLLGRP
jgi:hypothetical protein